MIEATFKRENGERSEALSISALTITFLAGLFSSLGLAIIAPTQLPHNVTVEAKSDEQFLQLLFSGSRPDSLEFKFGEGEETLTQARAENGIVFTLGTIAVSESHLGRSVVQTEPMNLVTSEPCRENLRLDFRTGEMVVLCGSNDSFQKLDIAGFETRELNVSGLAWVAPSERTTLASIQIVGPRLLVDQSLIREVLRVVAIFSIIITPLLGLSLNNFRNPKLPELSRARTPLVAKIAVSGVISFGLSINLALAPEKTDDGWNLAVLRASDRNGVLSSVFGDNWTSGFGGVWYSIVRFFLGNQAAIIDLRLLATLLLLGTLAFTIMFLRQIETFGKLAPVGVLAGFVGFHFFAGAYVLSSRPEVFTAFLLSLLIYFSRESANPENMSARLIVALSTAVAIATHPTGFVLLPGFLYLVATWWRELSSGGSRAFSSLLSPVLFFLIVLGTQIFWSLDFRTQIGQAIHVGSDHRYGVFDEITRFRWVTEYVSAAEASTFALLSVALIAIVFQFLRSEGPQVQSGMVVASLAPLGLILTPSKWWHHYGVLLPLVFVGLYFVFRYLSQFPLENWVRWTFVSSIMVVIVGTFSYSKNDFGYLEQLGWSGVSYNLLERFGPAPLLVLLLLVVGGARIAKSLNSRRVHHLSVILLLIAVTSTATLSFVFRALDAVTAKEWVMSRQVIAEASGHYNCGLTDEWPVIDLESSGPVSATKVDTTVSVDATSSRAIAVFSSIPTADAKETALEVEYFDGVKKLKSTVIELNSAEQGILLSRQDVDEATEIAVTALGDDEDFLIGVIESPEWAFADIVLDDESVFLGPEEVGRFPCSNFSTPTGGIWDKFNVVIANQSQKNYMFPSTFGSLLFPISEPRINGDVVYAWSHVSRSGLFINGSLSKGVGFAAERG